MSEDKTVYEAGSYSSLVGNPSYSIFGTSLSEIFDPEAVRNIIQDPMANNKVLRELSRIVYNANGVVANTIDKMVALPTLDKVVVPYGESKQKKRKNQVLVQSVLESLRDRELVRDCLQNAFIDGIGFYYVEVKERKIKDKGVLSDRDVESISEINESVRASAISLQPEFTKVIGLKNSSPVLAFDLSYLMLDREMKLPNQNCGSFRRKFVRRMRLIQHEPLGKPSISGWC